MLFPDVNVLVHAQRGESEIDRTVRVWLENALNGHEAVGIAESVLASMVRIVTHPRVFEHPSSPSEALEFARVLMEAPTTVVLRPGARHWAIFDALVRDGRLRGNDILDAYLAAVALEAGATMVTRDRGFARFAVRTIDPIA